VLMVARHSMTPESLGVILTKPPERASEETLNGLLGTSSDQINVDASFEWIDRKLFRCRPLTFPERNHE